MEIVSNIKLSENGFKSIALLFASKALQTVMEFKFNDIYLENPYEFMTLVDSLVNHNTLSHIEFCRDEINEETAAAVI